MQIKHFMEQKDSDSQAWVPLKPGTIAARKLRRKKERAARKALGTKSKKDEKKTKKENVGKRVRTGVAGAVKILQDRGRLKASIVRYSDRNVAITGTNTIYAATHQFGREGGGWQESDIPAREFIYLNDGERTELVDFVSNEILKPLMKN